jgi:2-oxoglutarate dehydrogenase E2 component (dihydrolipoamide succinyltransferase)
MAVEIKIPSPGESIREVEIVEWLKPDGSWAEKDEALCEVESEKVTLTLHAEESGQLKILIPAGTTANVGDVACSIDTEAERKEPERDEVKEPVKSEKPESISEEQPQDEPGPRPVCSRNAPCKESEAVAAA